MAQDGDAGCPERWPLVDLFGDLIGAALHALGHDDHEVGAAGQTGPADGLDQVLLVVDHLLGTTTAVAPQATPTFRATWPAWRPMTSTTEQRSWDCMVSRSLSMDSRAVLQAVSKPMV